MDRDIWDLFTSTGQLEAYLRYKELEQRRERKPEKYNGNAEPNSDWDLLHG